MIKIIAVKSLIRTDPVWFLDMESADISINCKMKILTKIVIFLQN
jgi:hypothetical protein